MTDELEEGNQEEKPEIYQVKKDGKGFSFSRRDFLVTAAAGTAAVAALGAGIGSLTPDAQAPQVVRDESKAVWLEVEALGMIVVPLKRGVEHVWKITNQGKNACPRAVLHLTAAHDAQFKQDLPVPEIAPGQSVEVPVRFMPPEQAGEYRYQWQLRLSEGEAKSNPIVVLVEDAILAQSLHPYANNTNATWVINNPDSGAAASYIHFSRLEVEDSFDNVYVKDGSGTVVQTISGSYPSGLWSSKVNGAVVQVQLVSDDSYTYWGFVVDAITSTIYLSYLPVLALQPTPTKVPTPTKKPTPTSYVVCTCNTVEVCTCNLVCTCEAVCSCDGYSICTCNLVYYWYPN